jgi:hydroxymethylpyrimidine pyrophosphatase-like HAD family hydrolase
VTTFALLTPGPRYSDWHPGPPQLVLSDLDGTYLEPDESVPDDLRAATVAALESGVRFGFATGRLPAGLPALGLESHEQYGPHIVHNGAQVTGGSAPEVTDAVSPLREAHVRHLMRICADHGLYGEFFTAEGFFVTYAEPRAAASWETISGAPDGLMSEWRGEAPIIKATVIDYEPSDLSVLVTEITEVGVTAEVSTAPVAPGAAFINVTAGASKGTALDHILTVLQLDAASVIVIGDGLNDVSMLERAGTAVVVAGAPAAVIAHAHLIAPTPVPVLGALTQLVIPAASEKTHRV